MCVIESEEEKELRFFFGTGHESTHNKKDEEGEKKIYTKYE